MAGGKRLEYIDTAKGLLMLMVIGIHILGLCDFFRINPKFFTFVLEKCVPFFNSFYMPAFFVITGLCANFDKPFGFFFVNNLKSLVFPSLFFTLFNAFLFYGVESLPTFSESLKLIIFKGGAYWFLTALFFSKIFYWFLFKYFHRRSLKGAVCLLLCFLGVAFHQVYSLSNYWYIYHAMAMTVFLFVGSALKDYRMGAAEVCILFVVFIFTIFSILYLGVECPSMHYGFSVHLDNYPMYLFLSFIGTIVFLELCKRIRSLSILQFIGRNSLSFFIFEFRITTVCILFLRNHFAEITITEQVLLCIAILLINVFINSIFAKSINTKYLKWTLGKF